MECAENNCEQAECHRCFPVSGCDDHQKCRSITHPEVGQKVVFESASGPATGTVLQVRHDGYWPDVHFESHLTRNTLVLSSSWLNWKGDPWGTLQVTE